jgi:toxin ParE1/3/4
MASYRLTKKAAEDIALIWNYTVDTWSENQADHYFHMLLDSCQDISDGRVIGKQYEGIYSGLLGKKAGKHIIFYRMINPDVVEIVRILHERMDLKKRIKE